jgi:Fe-S oxidoreductase
MNRSLLITAYPTVGSEIIRRRIANYGREVVEVGIPQLRCDPATSRPLDLSLFDTIYVSGMYPFFCAEAYHWLHKFGTEGKQIILGGSAPTVNPNAYLEMFDQIALGECDYIDLPLRHKISRFTAPYLSPPLVVSKDSKIAYGEGEIEVSRGCKHRCHFCPIPRIYKYKEQSVSRILDLLSEVPDAYWNFVSADIFGYSGFSKIVDFCYENDIKIRGSEGRIDSFMKLDRETQDKYLSIIRPKRVSFGIEGYTEDMRERLGKPISDLDIYDAAQICDENKCRIKLFLLADIGEEKEGIELFSAFIRDLPVRQQPFIHITPLVRYPFSIDRFPLTCRSCEMRPEIYSYALRKLGVFTYIQNFYTSYMVSRFNLASVEEAGKFREFAEKVSLNCGYPKNYGIGRGQRKAFKEILGKGGEECQG